MNVLTIDSIHSRFVRWCTKNRAENTVKHYESRLAPFIRKFGNRFFRSITPLELEDYFDEVDSFPDGSPKAPDTRRSNIIAFEQLERFAIEHGELDSRILAKIEKPSGRKRERIPTEEETETILQNSPPEFALIYRALRQCGARPGELCQLQISDLDWDNKRIELQNHKTARKTGKPRIIVIGDKLGEIFKESIGDRTEGPVFVNAKGDAWTSQKLGSVFSRIRKNNNLPKDLCVYLTRHEHATELCKKKGIRAAQLALGHANISTTERYDHPDEEEGRKNQDLF